MGRFDSLKRTIASLINNNGKRGITGNKMQDVLLDMLDAVDDAFNRSGGGGGGGYVDPELFEGFMPINREFSDEFNDDFAR